jgi:hypothetical protein
LGNQSGSWQCDYGCVDISDIYSLKEVFVWESFHPDSVGLMGGNQNFRFNYNRGICSPIGAIVYSPSEFSIFPNPARNMLTIETVVPGPYNIDITSLNGQLIFIGEMEGTSHEIDLTSFDKGTYFITIRSKDFLTTRKIIKL